MLRAIYSPVLGWALANRKVMLAIGLAVPGWDGPARDPSWQRVRRPRENNYWIRASLRRRWG